MRRLRILPLLVAILGLGAILMVMLPGVAGNPETPAGQDTASVLGDLDAAGGGLLALIDEDVPPPLEPEVVAGLVSATAVGADGILTVAGKTLKNGYADAVKLEVWIDREPVPFVPAAAKQATANPDPELQESSAASDSTAEQESTDQPEPTVAPQPGSTEVTSTAGENLDSEPSKGDFEASVQLKEGPQEVCTIAVNDAGPDEVLDCREVMYRAQLVDGKMIIADYGSGATPRLGIAGEGTPMEAAERIAERAKEWEKATGIPTIPAFDYIQTVAQASPGSDGDYSAHTSREDLDEYLAAIRSVDGLLILDFQPGGSPFMKQVSQYEEYLKQPDVGLALDTEWRMPWGVAPATIIGYTHAEEINDVGEYLAGIVAENDLPQKAFVVHQFRSAMVRNRSSIVDRPELATIFHIDGHGTKQLKQTVYRQLLPEEHFYTGFKLFFDEDTGLMTPLEVRDNLARVPAMVSYQ